MINFKKQRQRITEWQVGERSRADHAEIHTPTELIDEMLDKLPSDIWKFPDKTWLDPCAGIGNFPLSICQRLMEGLKDELPNFENRYRHIMKNQIYMVELQEKNCWHIIEMFDVTGDIILNLKCADALKLPYSEMKPQDWKCSAKNDYQNMFKTEYGTLFTFFDFE